MTLGRPWADPDPALRVRVKEGQGQGQHLPDPDPQGQGQGQQKCADPDPARPLDSLTWSRAADNGGAREGASAIATGTATANDASMHVVCWLCVGRSDGASYICHGCSGNAGEILVNTILAAVATVLLKGEEVFRWV